MPPKPDNAVITFRKKMSEEWHPNGRSYILMNPYDASVLQVIDARKQPPASKLLEKVYPVHGAFVGGFLYKAIIGLGSLVSAGLVLSGFIIWRRNKALN